MADYRIKSFYAAMGKEAVQAPAAAEEVRCFARADDGRLAVFLADPPLEDAIAQVRAEWFPSALALVIGGKRTEGGK